MGVRVIGLFDLFTGDDYADAAEKTRNYLGVAQNNLINSTGAARDSASNVLRDAFGNARTDLSAGLDTATGAIKGSTGSALGYLDTGARGATDAIRDAYVPLSDLGARFRTGSDMYRDALGLGGAEGTARARGAFQAGPGYEFMLDQGIDALNRRANAAGMLAGGNANRSAIDYATGLANKEYSSWLDRLSPYNNLELGATAGAAAGNASAAPILNAAGQNKATLASREGMSIADLARSLYGAQAGLDTGEGASLANLITGANKDAITVGLNVAPQYTGTFKQEADAETAGAKNALNLGVSLASLLTGNLGGMGGMGLGGGSLGLPGGNLGLGGMGDASMWNSSLPKNGFNW